MQTCNSVCLGRRLAPPAVQPTDRLGGERGRAQPKRRAPGGGGFLRVRGGVAGTVLVALWGYSGSGQGGGGGLANEDLKNTLAKLHLLFFLSLSQPENEEIQGRRRASAYSTTSGFSNPFPTQS